MATFNGGPVEWFAAWNAIAFAGAFLVNSFVEWTAHRYVLHGTRFGRFAYDLHDRQHHVIFDGGSYYHAKDDFARAHITFVPRDYILFLLVTTPIWIGAELLAGCPFLVGGVLATLAGLQMFNSFHLWFHDPRDSWFERTRFFRFLKEHHRLHHEDPKCNLNVFFLPVADWVFGTLRR